MRIMYNSSIHIHINRTNLFFIYIQNQMLFPVLQMEMVGYILIWAVVSRNANDIEEHSHRMILLICAVVVDTNVGALYVVVHEKQMLYAS